MGVSSPNIFLYLVYACSFVSLDVQHLNCFDFLNSDRFYLFADLEGMSCFSFSDSKIKHTLLTLHDVKSVKYPPHTPSNCRRLFTGQGFLVCSFKQ